MSDRVTSPASPRPVGPDEPMVPPPSSGRIFRARRRVRLADAAPSGRLRLDACARYLQDIGNDDTADSGLDAESGAWVVRRAVIDVIKPAQWGQWLDLATWCGGTGGRWAERRLAIAGDDGPAIQLNTLWVHLNPETFIPTKLPPSFLNIYGDATGGRKVSSKLWLAPPPSHDGRDHLSGFAWPLRAVDFDVMRHLNNAAYWVGIEEVLARRKHPLRREPMRAILEYGPGIVPGSDVELLVREDETQLDIWFNVDGTPHATARLRPL